ncbi:unnamed protein product [Wuchereria bancrofti]|uniref:Uncharacterized protein n=1 Tax=Wuchereria bancrofti TaxID=6293 RepID=A0A3P7E0V5_WUCBA|nr:unnamed protein product [Wuchereria bancrofti]
MTSGNIATDNDMELNFEITDQDGRDATQDSLTEEAKFLLTTHKPTRADIFQKERTPSDYRSNTLTPSTVKRTRSVLSDATPVSAAFSEDTLSSPQRHTYLNIAETKEENKQLREEISDLKSQLLLLKRKLLPMLDSQGKDFSEEHMLVLRGLDNEKIRQAELKQICQLRNKKLDEGKSQSVSERNDWEKERERLLMNMNELTSELKKARQQLFEKHGERDDCNESQGDSSLSTISLISERGMEIERLRSIVLQQNVDEKKLRMKMEQNIIQLQDQLKLAQDNLAKQNINYAKEKTRCETLKTEMTKLQQVVTEARQEVEYQKQISEEQLAKAHAINEFALNKRDRTIRILLKKLKSVDAQASSTSKVEASNLSSPRHDVLNLNPYAQAILDQINEFTVENDAIRKKVIEWGAVNIDLTEIESSETASTEDESSEWNTKHCERENEKLAAFLAQNKTIPDISNEELREKLALFDAVNDSGRRCSKEKLDDTPRSMGASEMLNVTSTADLLSKSLTLTEDLGEIKKKLSVLQSSCTRLFEKLRGTANFLQTLLDELGSGDQGRELLAQIEALRIDLDHSLATAIDISRDVEAAEEGIGDLSAHLQQSLLNCSFGVSSVPSNENQDASALSRAQRACRRLNAALANEKMKVNDSTKLNEKLQAHVTDLEESKEKLIDELNELKKNMARKKSEMISSVKDVEIQLQHKNQQYDELCRKVEELQQTVKAKEVFVVEKEFEMKQLKDQMNKKCHELEVQVKEITHNLKVKDESIEEKKEEYYEVKPHIFQKLLIDVESYNDQLLSRNNELAHYRSEIIGLENKMCELIGTLRGNLGIVQKQVDKPVVEAENMEIAALAQLSQIAADFEELTKVSHYIADLKNEMANLQRDLDLCERSRNAISLKCRGLSDQNAYLEAERNGDKQKLFTLQQQVQIEKESVKMMERDLQRLKSENSYVKENNERLTNMLVNVETKYEELISKPNRSSLSERQHSERYTVAVSTMTLMSSHDFVELTDKAKTLASFTKRMYTLAARWNGETVVTTMISYKPADLDHLYHTYARILNCLSDGFSELRNKIVSGKVKLQSIISEEQQNSQQTKSGNSRSSNDELGTNCFIPVDGSQKELVSVDLRTLFNDADQIVQKLSAISNRLHNAEILEVLSNVRLLQFQIDYLRGHSRHFEKTKENFVPMEALQLENERLQTALTDARILLQRAHERLNKLAMLENHDLQKVLRSIQKITSSGQLQPNSKDMCEQILCEMNEISKVMKATTREVHRVGNHSRVIRSYK